MQQLREVLGQSRDRRAVGYLDANPRLHHGRPVFGTVVPVTVVVVVPVAAVEGEIARTIKNVAPTNSTTMTSTTPREGW